MSAEHIVINGWFAGQAGTGSGQYLEHLLVSLQETAPGLRWTLLSPKGAPVMHRPGITSLSLGLPRLPRTLSKLYWEQITVPNAARYLAADVLWVPYWAAPLRQPVPTVVTVHDVIPLVLPEYSRGVSQRLYTRLVSASALRSAQVLTVSHAAARDIVAALGIDERRVHAIYHGPNYEVQAEFDSRAMARVIGKYALPERYFLYLGGFDTRKNVGRLLEGYAAYLRRGGDPAVKLVMAGATPQAETGVLTDPRRVVAQLGLQDQVIFCGWVEDEDKPALYALSTAYVFPSLYEGFGMTVVEAMAAGAPVITSRAAG